MRLPNRVAPSRVHFDTRQSDVATVNLYIQYAMRRLSVQGNVPSMTSQACTRGTVATDKFDGSCVCSTHARVALRSAVALKEVTK